VKTKKTFIAKLNIFILTVLLILSLIPLALTVITSIVPEGDLFNITKEVELSDFELPPFFLTKKIFPIESEKFDTVDGDNNSGKVLQLDTKDCVTGIMVNIGDVDLNKIKEFTFSLNTSQKIKTFYLGFKDVQGMQEFLPAELTYVSGKWNNAIVHVNADKYVVVDKEHLNFVGLKFEFENNEKILIDNVTLRYKFPTLWNYKNVLQQNDFARYMLNSAIVSACHVFGNLIFCSMAAYVFARKKFRGKEVLFAIVLSSMMIPLQVKIIPIFKLMQFLGWIDTLYALIAPGVVTSFGIFFMRQYIEQIPFELDQSAYVDGANDFKIFTKIIMPLSTPALAVLAINTFVASWNDLYMPLILTSSNNTRTVQVGLATFNRMHQVAWPELMAASSVAGIPIIIIFLIFQKKIISGMVEGAVKY
jgi:multiple sugar transport system permease protein